MTFRELNVFLQIILFASFRTLLAQIPDVGHIFIGKPDPITGLPVPEDYLFSSSDLAGKVLPVYAVVFSGSDLSQTVSKTENVTITCDVPAARPGYSGVQIDTVTLNSNENSTLMPLILTTPGRPVVVKCFAQSLSAACPVAVGGAQFCPQTSESNSVSVTIRSAGSVSLCEPVMRIKNNGPGSDCGFSVRLSESATSNVTVTCSSNGSLNLTFQPLVVAAQSVGGQMTCRVQSGDPGSEAIVTCRAQSQGDSQFIPTTTVGASTARFILGSNTVNFQPRWSQIYNTTFSLFFYLSEPVQSGSVSVSCQASLVSSILDAENAVRTPDCSFTTNLPTTASTTTVTTTTTTTTVTTTTIDVTTDNGTDVNKTTAGTTSAPPTTPQPTTPPDPTSPWRVVNSPFDISSSPSATTSSSLFQSVTTERLREVISVRTEVIVTTCCVLPSSSNRDYLNQSTVAVTVAHLAPFVCSQCNNASFTNPGSERILQNPGFVEVAPCACDVTLNTCDINCCCDLECSRNERARFRSCIPGLHGGQLPEPQDYKCSSNGFNQPDWQTLTCVYWENNWYLGMFYMNRQKLENIDKISSEVYRIYRGKFSLSETERRFTDQDSVQTDYKYGTMVRTVRKDVAANIPTYKGTLAMSQPGPGAACNPLTPVRYLVDQASSCKTMVTQDDCTGLSVLSAGIYAASSTIAGCSQSYKVLKTLNGDEVAPTDVWYYCATDLSPYLPYATASLESLDPTSSSRFPAVLSNVNCSDGCSDPVCWQYNRNRSTETTSSLPSPCSWDDAFTSPRVPTIVGDTCTNVVVEVRYNFEWKGQEITKLSAAVILADIPSVGSSGAEIVQKFSVRWLNKANTTIPLSDNYGDTTDTYQRSGSAGYDMGKPLSSGCAQYNVTTGQFDQVDVISEKQMAIWRPGVNGLCIDAMRQPVTFGDDVLSACALRLTFSDLNNTCHELRQLLSNHLNVLMAADVIGRYGYNDVNNENMWIPVLRQPLNNFSSDTQVASAATTNMTATANSTGINETEELRSWADSIAGICLLPSAVNLHVLYAQAGAVNGYPRYEVVGAYIKFYTRCDPDNFVTDPCYRYFTDFATEECYYDTCWQELAYPLLPAYHGDPQIYSLPFFLVLVLGVIGYVSVARPGWS